MTMLPLGTEDVLFVKGDRFDPEELMAALAPLGLEAFLIPRAELAAAEIRRTMINRGISSVWQTAIFEEKLLPCKPDPDVPALVDILRKMLEGLAPESEFVVVDRYLLSTKTCPSDYIDMLVQVLEPTVRRVRELLVVTSREHHNAQLEHALEQRIQTMNPGCRFRCANSDSFHDRFWIADGDRGLFVGTSLNGLGLRYALVDYIAPDDVLEIATALRREGLLDA